MIQKLLLFNLALVGFLSASEAQISTSTPTSTTTTTTTSGGSVNGALNEAKKSNTLGMVANIAGGGLHAVTAYQNWAMCTCPGTCAPCFIAAANAAMAISSMGQAGSHGQSNQNLTPDLCKTAAGICNPSQFQWPDFNSCSSGDASCYNSVISNSGNPDLNSIFSGTGVSTGAGTSTSTAFNDYNKMLESMAKAGATYDLKTGAVTFQGKMVTANDLNNPSALKSLGLSDSDLAKIAGTKTNADKAISKLSTDPAVQSAVDGAAVNAAMAAANGSGLGTGGKGNGNGSGPGSGLGNDGSFSGAGLDVVGGGAGAVGSDGNFADGDDPTGSSGKKGSARSMKDRMERVPASVAGKKRIFNGEPIGVAGDSIFDMMTRRYQVKTQQNSFIEQVMVAPK